MTPSPHKDPPVPFWRRLPSEAAGACGDLGTFLPHVIGAITVAGLAPAGVLAGFGAFFVASGLFYGLPMAVQPMKAVSAVLVTGQAGPGEVAAAGMAIGRDPAGAGSDRLDQLAGAGHSAIGVGRAAAGSRPVDGTAGPRADLAHAVDRGAGPGAAGGVDAGAALSGRAGDARRGCCCRLCERFGAAAPRCGICLERSVARCHADVG